jgi:hypothetical protein
MLRGVGNGDPTSHEPDQANTRSASRASAWSLSGRITDRRHPPHGKRTGPETRRLSFQSSAPQDRDADTLFWMKDTLTTNTFTDSFHVILVSLPTA